MPDIILRFVLPIISVVPIIIRSMGFVQIKSGCRQYRNIYFLHSYTHICNTHKRHIYIHIYYINNTNFYILLTYFTFLCELLRVGDSENSVFMGQCLQTYTERDWNFSSQIKQTTYMLPGWCLSVGALISHRLESISSEERRNTLKSKVCLLRIIHWSCLQWGRKGISEKVHMRKMPSLCKRRDTSLSDRCGQSCHLSLT